MNYHTTFRRAFAGLAFSVAIAFPLQALQPDEASAAALRQFKKNHFFSELFLRGVFAPGIQTYAEAEAGQHPNPLAAAGWVAATNVAVASITNLASKSLSRYTPLGVLKKQELARLSIPGMSDPIVFRGKALTGAGIDCVREGIVNAALLRKQYGSFWMFHFGKNYFLPIVAKSVILSAVAPQMLGAVGFNSVMAWGMHSWWKYELAMLARGYAYSGVSWAYDTVISCLKPCE